MRIYRCLLLSVIFYCCSLNLYAQNNFITLTVNNESGEPLSGATLNNSTQQYSLPFDVQGKLKLKTQRVSPDDLIKLTCIGYISINLKGRDLIVAGNMAYTLPDDIINLKEITVSASSNSLNFKDVQSLPFPLFNEACITDGNYLYTISGFTYKGGINTQALKYDPQNNTWSLLAHNLQPTARAVAQYMPIKNKIYVMGGLSSLFNYVYFDKVETIDIKTGNVEVLSVKNPMPSAYGGSAVWNNKMYIFGGSNNGRNDNTSGAGSFDQSIGIKTFYEFDPILQKFTRLADMPEGLQTSGAIVDGILYTFGGFETMRNYKSRLIQAYDISKKTWKMVGKLPIEISAYSVAVYDHLIFITGDYDDNKFTGYYNTHTQKFVKLKSNIISRKHLGSAVLLNHLLVIGGSNLSNPTGIRSVQAANLKNILHNDL